MKERISGSTRIVTISRVLNSLFTQGPLSRTQLGTLLELDKAVVSKITAILQEQDLLVSAGQSGVGTRGGRRQIYLDINTARGTVAGIDFSGEPACVRYYDLKGTETGSAEQTIDMKKLANLDVLFIHLKNDYSSSAPQNRLSGAGLCSIDDEAFQSSAMVAAAPPHCCCLAAENTDRTALFVTKALSAGKVQAKLYINASGNWTCRKTVKGWEGSIEEFTTMAGFFIEAGNITNCIISGLPPAHADRISMEISRKTGIPVKIVQHHDRMLTRGAALIFLQELFEVPRAGETNRKQELLQTCLELQI